MRAVIMLTAGALIPSTAAAAPVLRSADIHVTMRSPASCEVRMVLSVSPLGGSSPVSRGGASAPPEHIEHRVEATASAETTAGAQGVELLEVRGATQLGEIRTIGRTRSLVLRPTQSPYEFRYRSTQPDDRAFRCPIWLPTVPTDGLSRAVRFEVELPSSAVPGGSMPAMTWSGSRGTATLGHVPAFVRVPYAASGEPRRWDIADVMDAAAVVTFTGASAVWIWRRRR